MTGIFLDYLSIDPVYYISHVVLITFSICLHEYAHAFYATRLGDPTPMLTGHLTMNPFKQMGWMSLAMLVFFGIAWGMVPVNPRNFRHRHGDAMVAIAGPAANLFLCGVFSLLQSIVMAAQIDDGGVLMKFFMVGAIANGALFFLNIIPVPPLDGFSVVGSFFPGLKRFAYAPQNAGMMNMIFIVLLLSGSLSFVWSAGRWLNQMFVF